jgi:hypothetical protein
MMIMMKMEEEEEEKKKKEALGFINTTSNRCQKKWFCTTNGWGGMTHTATFSNITISITKKLGIDH